MVHDAILWRTQFCGAWGPGAPQKYEVSVAHHSLVRHRNISVAHQAMVRHRIFF